MYAPGTEVTAHGETRKILQWATDLGCPPQTIIGRLNRGWPVDRAVSEKPGNSGGSNRGKKLPAEVLTPDELMAIIAQCKDSLTGKRNKALIVLAWRAGVRETEAVRLKPADVDGKQQTVRVLHGKGNKARTCGFDASTWSVIAEWVEARSQAGIPATSHLFCTEAGGELDTRYIREMVPRLARHAGVTKRVHFHGLRHTMAFELANEGVALHLIQQQLGHSNAAITSRYISHLNPTETINRMKQRSWDTAGNKPTPIASNLASPGWLERLRDELGGRLISFVDMRADAEQFKALLTLI